MMAARDIRLGLKSCPHPLEERPRFHLSALFVILFPLAEIRVAPPFCTGNSISGPVPSGAVFAMDPPLGGRGEPEGIGRG